MNVSVDSTDCAIDLTVDAKVDCVGVVFIDIFVGAVHVPLLKPVFKVMEAVLQWKTLKLVER